MKLKFKKPSKRDLIVIGSLTCVPPAVFALFSLFGLFVSYSGSVPVGIYKKVSYKTNYAIFCLPDRIAKIGFEHKFIDHSRRCVNGFEPLIKYIIARPNDKVEVYNDSITVNDEQKYFAPFQKADSHNMPLERITLNGQTTSKGYWLYGNGAPQSSWDSRYFGEIPKDKLITYAKPILTI